MKPEEAQVWRDGVADLAKSCPNVVAKLGGVQMQMMGWDFSFGRRAKPIGSQELCEKMLPWYGHVLDSFGPNRCMFESNFPVDKDSCSHRTLYNMYKRVCNAKGLSAADKKAIFHDTATRIYRLNDDVAKL